MNRTKLRIIMIGLNESAKIAKTFPRLEQAGLIYDTIFIDSESTDCSRQICERYSVRFLLYKGIKTAAGARQFGADRFRAEAEWTFFLDGDVVPSVEFLEALKVADKTNADAWFGWKRDINSEGVVTYHTRKAPINSPDFLGGNFVIRTDVLNDVGGWDSDLAADEERHLLARIYSAGYRARQLDINMGDHLNQNKEARSIKQKYLGLRAKYEAETFFKILNTHPIASLKVYKFSYIFLLGIISGFFHPALAAFIMFGNHLLFCNQQPGKYLLVAKIALYLPYLKWQK